MNKKLKSFTMADRRSSRIHISNIERIAFTMAEILLSLTIIGVVAAITLPSLTGNINERTWNTQRKALYARMSQAIALMPSLNGWGTYVAEVRDEDDNIITSGTDNVAITFVTNGLAKVLKINNICDNDKISDCGIPDSIKNNRTTSIITVNTSDILTMNKIVPRYVTSIGYIFPATRAVAFETQNGESILTYVNPQCRYDKYSSKYMVCVNFIYDLNGKKGPNTIGKDIGYITAINPTDAIVVAPLPTQWMPPSGVRRDALEKCKEYGEDIKLPTIEELVSLWTNDIFENLRTVPSGLWSNSPALANGKYYDFATRYGTLTIADENVTSSYICIKR